MSEIIKYLLTFIIGIVIGYLITPNNSVVVPPVELEGLVQDSIKRDSIHKVNDTIITKIIYLEKEYEKEVETIMSNDDSTNYVLFSGYIEDYKRAITNN